MPVAKDHRFPILNVLRFSTRIIATDQLWLQGKYQTRFSKCLLVVICENWSVLNVLENNKIAGKNQDSTILFLKFCLDLLIISFLLVNRNGIVIWKQQPSDGLKIAYLNIQRKVFETMLAKIFMRIGVHLILKEVGEIFDIFESESFFDIFEFENFSNNIEYILTNHFCCLT